MRSSRLVVLLATSLAAACGGSSAVQTASSDDAGIDDASTGDASAHDAVVDDTGPTTNDSGSTANDSTTTASDSGSGASDSGASPTDAGPGKSTCKRGIAANAAPSAAMAPSATQPGVAWWYDWSNEGTGAAAGIEFTPMIWGAKNLAGSLPSSARFVLGFNEPNFKAQSNLTPPEAAADWPSVQSMAKALGIPIVSPAVNFCGSTADPSRCSDPTITDPYTYLKDFVGDCAGCEVDAIAVHWYNCDLPSLKAYIDGGTTLAGFVQFGKPIWLTEFSCDGSHSAADQRAYMEAAIPYLESNPHVFRYAWFSAKPIPNAVLQNDDGTLTDLGKTYASLAAPSCP